MQAVFCNDLTCRHNKDGVCWAKEVLIRIDVREYHPVNVCESYEDNRNDATD